MLALRGIGIVWIAAAVVLSGCGGGGGVRSAGIVPGPGALPDGSPSKIQHVVIVVQENRSLNNLFYGFPGARTATYGYNSKNQKVALQPVTLATKWDLAHYASGYFAACNGTGSIPGTNCRMNGFDLEKHTCGASGQPPCPIHYPEYAYVPAKESAPYFAMASQYVLADEMFASNFDASSFISHQYLISAQNDSAVNYPTGSWGCSGDSGDTIEVLGPQRNIPDGTKKPCWDPKTLGDELDRAGKSWAYYASAVTGDGGIWSAYQAVTHIYHGPDWNANVISPQTQFFKDVAAGNLRSVTWITPTYENSDHAGSGSKTGPSWVASVVNAIGGSKFWNTTAIFVLWDDYGGWYDPQAPAYVDNDGLGIRLPLLVISPYAKANYVSHVHYEHGSILRFIEDRFGLGRLAASDARANSPLDCFDFAQSPRPFVKIAAPLDRAYFMHQPPDARLPDDD